MIKTVYLNHQPLVIEGIYDLEANFGLINIQLPNREYLKKFDCWSYSRMFDHYNHYMWAMWGKEVEWHSSENNTITFSKTKVSIDIDMDSDGGYVKDIKLLIEDTETFNQFIGIFTNQDLSIKYCKSYRVWKEIEEPNKSSGIEIEINSPTTPEKRRKLIAEVKKKFGNNVYIETEANKDFPLEFTSNVVNIDNLESTYDIVDFLINNGCSIGEYSNIHIHISSKFFGNSKQEIINNLHKILILDYYHGKKEPFIKNITGTFFYTDDMCKKYKLNITQNDFVEELHKSFHNKDSSTKEDIYPRIDYFKWLRDADNYHSIEFKWCLLKDRQTFNKSIELLRKYLSVINLDKHTLLNKCSNGDFKEIFGD